MVKRLTLLPIQSRVGEVIAVKEGSKSSPRMKQLLENLGSRTVPGWLSLDANAAAGTIIALPTREDIQMPIQEHLIVEKYSR